MVKVSTSPAGGPKTNTSKSVKQLGRGAASSRGATTHPPSTMLTSPLSGPARRQKGKNRYIDDEAGQSGSEDRGYIHDDFATSDGEDAFEPVRHKKPQPQRRAMDLGPPITTDDRMKDLPEVHRVFIHQFVDEAKKLEESIRNSNGNKKAYFTESNFREMAISWTMTLEDMRELPSINPENVTKFGKRFIRLVENFHKGYEEAMSANEDRDIDKNHQNVIDLCSDEDDFTEDEDDDDHMSQADQLSKFFASADVQNFNEKVAQAQLLPQRTHAKPDPPKKVFRGGFGGKGRGRGGRRGSARRSTGSNSGSGGNRSREGQSDSRVTKRKASAGSSKAPRSTQILNAFSRQGGSGPRGSSGMGGGIGMMPT
jgi:bloom syndrome protein